MSSQSHSLFIYHYHNAILYISSIHFYNLCYSSVNSIVLNVGLTRLGNLIFDNSLLCLLCSMFVINLINLNAIFLLIYYHSIPFHFIPFLLFASNNIVPFHSTLLSLSFHFIPLFPFQPFHFIPLRYIPFHYNDIHSISSLSFHSIN